MDFTAELPDLVVRRARAQGEAGERWLTGLGALVTDLAQCWHLQVGRVLHGGTEALVLEAAAAGTPAVLKIAPPGAMAPFADEVRVLELANGAGYAALLAHDLERQAILLERLGEKLADGDLPLREQIESICDTLRIAWRPIGHAHGLMTGAGKARWHAEYIASAWERLAPECDPAVRTRAMDFAAAREQAFDPARSVLVHGDAHVWNTLLRADGSGCKFVDPDGLFAEPACDAAISMREWSEALLAGDPLRLGRERCRLLHDLTGADAVAIWQWGFLERVSSGLLLTHLGETGAAAQHFAIAERWLHD